MSVSDQARRFALPARILAHPRGLSAIAIGMVLCILAALATLHAEQRRSLEAMVAASDQLRAARLDLAEGFLHLALDGPSNEPFDRKQGRVLIAQAIATLEQEARRLGGEDSAGRQLPDAIALFKLRLSEWDRTKPASGVGTALRIAFHGLDHHTDLVDAAMRRNAIELGRSNDRVFVWAVCAALAILAGIYAIVLFVSRAREAVLTQLRESERQLQAHGDQLEATIRERTGALEDANRAILAHADTLADMSEALRQRAREAEAATLAKSTFLANMSHEMRTPLHAIIGLGHLARRNANSQRERELMDKIAGASSHLLAIINDILDITRIEAGAVELNNSPFALHDLLESAHASAAESARAKGLALTLDMPAETDGLFVSADRARLTRMLSNFLGNAIKFTDTGGVALAARTLQESDSDVLVRFEVRDSGIGIAPDAQARLFEPFVQLDASSSRRFGGAGLGLAINRRLATLMGGDIGVSSLPGVGSTFWLTARLNKAQPPGTASDRTASHAVGHRPGAIHGGREAFAEQQVAARHRGARILLVEDNPVNREVAVSLLASAGLDIAVAENGHEAVRMAQHARYDAVLMDMQMPVMDGLEATRLIRRMPGWASVPILALTSNAFDDDRTACLRAGMNEHVAKPVDPEVLFAALLRWLPAPPDAARVRSEVRAPESAEAPPDLTGIPGLDAERGRRHVGGDPHRYLHFLGRFADEHGTDATRLDALLRDGDRTSATRLAHTLKGLGATLGLDAVHAAAGALEAALREGNDPPPGAIGQLDTLLSAVCDGISASRNSPPARAGAHVPKTADTPRAELH